jgi:hypothetical protein
LLLDVALTILVFVGLFAFAAFLSIRTSSCCNGCVSAARRKETIVGADPSTGRVEARSVLTRSMAHAFGES